MTPYEQKLLDDFLTRLRGAGESVKDPQAEALICERLAGHPDAAYLLVQRALLLEQALASAQTQIAKLQQAAAGHDAGAGSGSFLGQAAWGTQQTVPPTVAPRLLPQHLRAGVSVCLGVLQRQCSKRRPRLQVASSVLLPVRRRVLPVECFCFRAWNTCSVVTKAKAVDSLVMLTTHHNRPSLRMLSLTTTTTPAHP